MAVEVCNEANFVSEGTFFQGYDWIAKIAGRESKATFNSCVISDIKVIGQVLENASLSVTNCTLDCSSEVLAVLANVRGKVELTKNKLSASTPRIFNIDPVSKRPKHDIDHVKYNLVVYNPMSGRSDKEKSKFTQTVKRQARQVGEHLDLISLCRDKRYKHCAKCWKTENASSISKWSRGEESAPAEHFRYCARCQSASYCSKECQVAHWPDHRLWCQKKDSPFR